MVELISELSGESALLVELALELMVEGALAGKSMGSWACTLARVSDVIVTPADGTTSTYWQGHSEQTHSKAEYSKQRRVIVNQETAVEYCYEGHLDRCRK